MAEYVAFDPNVEVLGNVLLAITTALGDRSLPTLAKHGIENIQAEDWYPIQKFMDAFQELSEGGTYDLVAIGMKIPDVALFPPEIKTIEQAFTLLDEAYHMDHRGGDIGEYSFRITGEKEGEVYCRNPYPSDFDYGIIYRLLQKYRPSQSVGFNVTRDDSVPNRKTGAEACTYTIKWD